MSLGDILFASGFDSKDPGIFDISGTPTYLTTNTRQALSVAKLGGSQCQAALRDTAGAQVGVGEIVIAFGFRTTVSNENYAINLTSPNGTVNMKIVFKSGNHLSLWRGNDTVLGIGSATLATNTWYWFWAYMLISDTVGVIRSKINGVTDIATTTSLDTRNDSGANGDKIDRFTACIDGNYEFDDMYIQDATGTTNNGDDIDLGEVAIPYLIPDSAGDTTGMTPSAGSNFQCVDEVPPNDDTDYVAAATSGTLDLYNLTTASATSVKGAVARARMKKDAAGAKNARILVKSGGTVSNGSDIALGTTYQSYPRNMRQNPVTAADWTPSEIAALQAGQEART